MLVGWYPQRKPQWLSQKIFTVLISEDLPEYHLFEKEVKNPIIAHLLSGGSLFPQVFRSKPEEPSTPRRHSAPKFPEIKLQREWMHDFTGSALMPVCDSAKRHLTLWVYWPAPFCLNWSDHQISHPLLHSLWTWKVASWWWTVGMWKRNGTRYRARLDA